MSLVRYSASSRIIVAALLFGLISLFFFGAIISGSVAQAADGETEEAARKILPLRLSLPEQVLNERAGRNGDHGGLRIVGVPPSCSLNRGFSTAGAWYVSLDDVKNLALLAPKNFKGSLVLTVNLIQASDRNPISWEVPLKILAGSSASQRPVAAENIIAKKKDVAAENTIAKKKDVAPPLVPATPSKNDRLQLERARKLLDDNDVASARLVLKRLAKANIAEAAFELAQTYDPDILQTIQTSGHAVDLKKARQWYMRAAQLGHSKATKRASELQGRKSPPVR